MAFLQICRRHQILFEGASASVKLLLTRKGFQSCRVLHSHESKHLRVEKKTLNNDNNFLEPKLHNFQSTHGFSTIMSPLHQKVATSAAKDVSAVDRGHKKKTKKAESNKKKADKSSAKSTSETAKGTDSKEIQNNDADSGAAKKKNPSHKYDLSRNSERKSERTLLESINKQKKGTSETSKLSKENKDILVTTVGTAGNDDEHMLDYGPEAILVAGEDDHHDETEMEDLGDVSHLAATKEFAKEKDDIDLDFLSDDEESSVRTESVAASEELEITSGAIFDSVVQTPKKYREGTAGGRLFEAQTLAEIDGYLFLGNPYQAEKLFNRYLRMGKKFDVNTFNKLLHGWAQKGNLMSVKLLFKLLKREGLEPDMGTYAALLHGYGKFDDVDGVQSVIKEMEEKEFDIRHIFHKCCLTEPQAKGVLKALRLVIPDYQPSTPESQSQIKYPALVKSWYSDRVNLDEKLQSVPGKLERELDEPRLKGLFEQQILQELSGFTPIKSVEDDKGDSEMNQRRKEMFLECRSKWRKALIESIEKELFEIKNSKGKSVHPRFAPFFQAFEPDELADITLDTIVFYVKGRVEGVPLYGVSGALGSVLNTKYIVKHRVQSGMLDKMKGIYHDYFSYLMDERLTAGKMAREFWNELDDMLPFGGSLQQEVPIWPWATKIVFGCSLVDCFLKSAQINVNLFNNRPEELILPAFYHTYEFKVNKKLGVLKPHPVVCKLFKEYLASQGEISMETTSVPMLVPPRPWRATKDGAYLILPVELVRSAGDEEGRYDKLLEEKTSKEDLVAVFDSLNFLGSCAWRTNKRILDIAIHMFNTGGNDDLAIPGPVAEPQVESKSSKSKANAEERRKQIQERRIAKKLAREQYSLRMSALYKLSVANHFRDHVFWLPINLDFRGRVYPIPPHCSHVGDDLSRGMLQFAKGAPLGEKGLDWLKIHLVALHGTKKKSSLKERLQYANDIMDDILDSADNPLTGRGWWKTADDPWQALATCVEIADATRSPDPTQFISHQPVHQDGSCNGLQHYAALGQDTYGAKQVNLLPADRPQDVYEEVAKLVEAARLRDAEAGHEIAKELEGKVTRKVVKQTVMTIVYGVTFVGGRLQIERQLKDLEMNDKVIFKASTYLVTNVFASIGEMFTAARAIQNWFASSATQIALSGHYVDWYTPLGLYVSQPYSKKPPQKVVRTKLQWMLIKSKGLPHVPPDSRKQRGAFPPNFVHSLDSTHMMLTALFCQRSGATFSSVHDSFWTHAANVGVMNRICREQFVALHNEPILEDLHEHFHKNYSDLKLVRPLKSKESGKELTHVTFEGRPDYGDFDIKEVINSTYFFC